ncbi:U2 small nuclear ribonucleoprotein auxiliary factor 35 kDa subunit-related protein 2 isoform X1 [Bombyx mandarina]|uniref:U2 small nuclear ribonucleoprotein auxiliary factor 35 kDa subunit-related protein 2 isoform X1 n=2 Tax=Bombyx mandarina TaxID=7092 RepID=A0A6J2JV71_BOMMA|nr:U2 small nuclear ribonucleoprotein auxiliary factor 35 kDa subunit-related protein 2 isoform X1 [Bombyx mandarina]
MGRHSEWRRIAKRQRRRKIRVQQAQLRDSILEDSDLQAQQQILDNLIEEQIILSNKIENEKWLQAEKNYMDNWEKLQQYKERLLQEKMEQKIKLTLEWEAEKERRKIEEEKLKQIKEENMKKHQEFLENLQKFMAGDSCEPPKELNYVCDTRPGAEMCTFFSKTATCRFGDQCSRNHQYPSISNVLLAKNFYAHFGLDNMFENNEYDADIMLEYDENETYKEFEEFFCDVLTEFEKFGKIVQFKVCKNYEKHLRGNTYIEYADLRCAVAAYRFLNSRWYGGRQLSLQFCNIRSWRNAICGLQAKQRCHKGRSCNFLHIFRNPNNLFSLQKLPEENYIPRRRTPPRSWRWSESPETEIPKDTKSSRESNDEEKKNRERRRSHKRKLRKD